MDRIPPSQIARRLGVSSQAIYSWIKRGLLPADCVIRDGKHIFIHAEKFREFVASGAIERSYAARRICTLSELISEDSITTRGRREHIAHRWTEDEKGAVLPSHPYGPGEKISAVQDRVDLAFRKFEDACA